MYFAALLARTEDGWEASDTELDDVETLADLADLAREAAADEGETVLVFIEQEDAWFGIVRVDGEDDPRVYVSDAAAAARSSYGEILTSELLGDDDPDDELADLDGLVDLDGTEDGEPERPVDGADEDNSAGSSGIVPAGPLGEGRILADLGLSERELLAVTEDALGEIADAIGASDILEAVR
ncbi:putative tRNA adenosine deaminase-associated protein [Streptomyces filamentosus]|uniref:tRNA adenosine deaminase-associated protein n=1 Tax=Streptomyces filamentosus TaxID=67294 RepID=UPI0033F6751D